MRSSFFCTTPVVSGRAEMLWRAENDAVDGCGRDGQSGPDW